MNKIHIFWYLAIQSKYLISSAHCHLLLQQLRLPRCHNRHPTGSICRSRQYHFYYSSTHCLETSVSHYLLYGRGCCYCRLHPLTDSRGGHPRGGGSCHGVVNQVINILRKERKKMKWALTVVCKSTVCGWLEIVSVYTTTSDHEITCTTWETHQAPRASVQYC